MLLYQKWAQQYLIDQIYKTFMITLTIMMIYGDKNLVNIGWGNDLLPDNTKTFPVPMLTNHSWCLVAFT